MTAPVNSRKTRNFLFQRAPVSDYSTLQALGLKDIHDINVTIEYAYRTPQPQTLYDPAWAEEIEVESYYVAGVYEDSTYVPISKEQSGMLLCLKPPIIDTLRLIDSIIDSRNDN